MTHPYILTNNSLTIFINGRSRTINKDNLHFEAVKDAIKRNEFDLVLAALDASETIVKFSEGRLNIREGIVYYDNYSLHNTMTDRILSMIKEGFDCNPLLKFLDNLMKNPSKRAVDELYTFLEHSRLPITPDGHFLAYKKVTTDFKDYHTQQFDNSPGRIVEMPRNFVDDNKDNVCSVGLHFCSLHYLKHYHAGEGKVIILKINPADVVSIPSDYDNTKGRTCKYEVLSEYTGPETQEAFTSPIVHLEIDDDYDSEVDDNEVDNSWLDEAQDYENEDRLAMGIIPPKDEDIRLFTPEESTAFDSYKGEEITLDGGTFKNLGEPIVITRILDGTVTIPPIDNGPETRTIPDHPDLNNNGVPDEVEALVGSVRKFFSQPDLEYTVINYDPVPDNQGTWYLITRINSTGYQGSREFEKVILDSVVKQE